MNNNEVVQLVDKYFRSEGYIFPTDFEHRFDRDSSAILYSLIRHYKPKNCLAIGTWEGGSTCVMMAAMLKNKNKANYVASELLDDKRMEAEQNCIKKNKVAPTMIGDITKNLNKVPKELDFLFVDTDHDFDTTKWIFENIMPRVKKGALVAFHDWAVEEKNGEIIGKGADGQGGWPETEYMMDLWRKKKLPFKKLYWGYNNPLWEGMWHPCESAFWEKL